MSPQGVEEARHKDASMMNGHAHVNRIKQDAKENHTLRWLTVLVGDDS